ncbi:uncharacterized protein LOC133320819 [Danaus plexippus]|uniref:uncharacterized protein LOC133320819 n=1 Tax=Danaus plexippus TaxID=13037 RepID=UPI002AB1466F|nr:uncharacterized protein LOC133320819 [Danaus plexippus]
MLITRPYASLLDLLLTTRPDCYRVSVNASLGSSDHCLVHAGLQLVHTTTLRSPRRRLGVAAKRRADTWPYICDKWARAIGPRTNLTKEANLATVNTLFIKKPEYPITYKSRTSCSQIDYLLFNRHLSGRVKNCKVIPGECIAPKHRLVVMDINFRSRTTQRVEKEPVLTKWWLLKVEKMEEFRDKLNDLKIADNVNDVNKVGCRQRFLHQQIKYLDKRKVESEYPKKHGGSCTRKKRKKLEKWSVLKDPNDSLETKNGQKLIFKLAKLRNQATKDFAKSTIVKSQDGALLLNTNPSTTNVSLPAVSKNLGLIPPITPQEVNDSLKKMANKKAISPGDIPIEAWKCLGEAGVVILANFFSKLLLETACMPEAWRMSKIIPLYKGKGSRYECNSYRGIKLMCHTMKLYERVIDSRLRMECSLSKNQYCFVPGLSTIDPTFAMTMIAEVYREKKEPLHIAFLDMEKAFDRVTRSTMWWSLRARNVPDAYVSVIADMYTNVRSFIRTIVGVTKSIPVTGVHQGSVLSPFLFSLVLDTLTEDA